MRILLFSSMLMNGEQTMDKYLEKGIFNMEEVKESSVPFSEGILFKPMLHRQDGSAIDLIPIAVNNFLFQRVKAADKSTSAVYYQTGCSLAKDDFYDLRILFHSGRDRRDRDRASRSFSEKRGCNLCCPRTRKSHQK
jgi:hypothetical protein